MKPLNPREQRIVALGLLAAAIAGAWLLLISPVIDGFQTRANQRQQLLARYQDNQRLLASIPMLRAAAQAERRTAAMYQITAPSEAMAAEALKQRLTSTLATTGGAVSAVGGVQHFVPFALEHPAEQEPLVRLVIDHQDPGHPWPSCQCYCMYLLVY